MHVSTFYSIENSSGIRDILATTLWLRIHRIHFLITWCKEIAFHFAFFKRHKMRFDAEARTKIISNFFFPLHSYNEEASVIPKHNGYYLDILFVSVIMLNA